MLTLGYLWRDRDGAAFLTTDELDILARSLRPLTTVGQDLVVVDPGAGEAECDAVAKLERLRMVRRGALTKRGKEAAREWLGRKALEASPSATQGGA